MAKKRYIIEADQLSCLLKKMYGDRVQIIPNPFRNTNCGVDGFFDSKKFGFTFFDQFLILSVEPGAGSIIDELTPILTEVMGGEKPLCSYDLQDASKEENVMPTIEWSLDNPDDRIKKIVNGKAFEGNCKIVNLKLYNSKSIEDYLESEEEKQEEVKDTKIYGIYPGCVDEEKVKNLSEVDLFFVIDELGTAIWRCYHGMANHRMSVVDLTEDEYGLEYCIYQTTRFGVELDKPEIGKHLKKTPSYDAWYKFYYNHFNKVLSQEEWDEFLKVRRAGGDVSRFMPSGDWRDLIEKPSQKTINE